jgi:hypothetical protein
MPNDALISELDRLRETYSQRQKATNNLLATLKGTTAALGKTNRLLREYADLNPNTNDIAKAQQSFSAGGSTPMRRPPISTCCSTRTWRSANAACLSKRWRLNGSDKKRKASG